VQVDGADLDPVGEKRGRETSDLDPSLPTSSKPRRRLCIQMHGGRNVRG